MEHHAVVSREEWLNARIQLMVKEKEFTRERDRLSQLRRDLPWVRVDQSYIFEGPEGQVTLPALFAGRHQLVVYHFMFAPEWEAGCAHCSFWADHYDAMQAHLAHRDVTMVVASRTPDAKNEAFKKRIGSEAIGAVDSRAGGFSGGVEAAAAGASGEVGADSTH